MHRLLINLPDELFDDLRKKSFEKKLSLSKYILSHLNNPKYLWDTNKGTFTPLDQTKEPLPVGLLKSCPICYQMVPKELSNKHYIENHEV